MKTYRGTTQEYREAWSVALVATRVVIASMEDIEPGFNEHGLACADLKDYTVLRKGKVMSLIVAETGNGGLRVRMQCKGDTGQYTEELSYFGPYSVRWRVEEGS